MSNVIKRLPVGTRIEIVDATNLRLEVGHRATLTWAWTGGNQFTVAIDGLKGDCCLPVEQCAIIIDGKGIALGKKCHGRI